MPDLLTGFAPIAVVLLVSAIAAGFVDRAPLSFPLIFLGLGVALGQRGLGLLDIGVHDLTLEAIAVLSPALVLTLGPGTILVIAVVAGAASARSPRSCSARCSPPPTRSSCATSCATSACRARCAAPWRWKPA